MHCTVICLSIACFYVTVIVCIWIDFYNNISPLFFLSHLVKWIIHFPATHHQQRNLIKCNWWHGCYCFMDHKSQCWVGVGMTCEPGTWQSFGSEAWFTFSDQRITGIWTSKIHMATQSLLCWTQRCVKNCVQGMTGIKATQVSIIHYKDCITKSTKCLRDSKYFLL